MELRLSRTVHLHTPLNSTPSALVDCVLILVSSGSRRTQDWTRLRVLTRDRVDRAEMYYPEFQCGDGLGIYEGAFYHAENYYRPLCVSRMTALHWDFGPVNGEQWILTSYEILSPVLDVNPAPDREVRLGVGEVIDLSVDLTFGRQVQKVEWIEDGVQLEELKNKTKVSWKSIAPGQYVVTAKVADKTGQVRKDPGDLTSHEITWSIKVQ